MSDAHATGHIESDLVIGLYTGMATQRYRIGVVYLVQSRQKFLYVHGAEQQGRTEPAPVSLPIP